MSVGKVGTDKAVDVADGIGETLELSTLVLSGDPSALSDGWGSMDRSVVAVWVALSDEEVEIASLVGPGSEKLVETADGRRVAFAVGEGVITGVAIVSSVLVALAGSGMIDTGISVGFTDDEVSGGGTPDSPVLTVSVGLGRTVTGVSVAFNGEEVYVGVATVSSILETLVVSGKTDTRVSVVYTGNELSVEVVAASVVGEVSLANPGVIEVELSVSFAGTELSVGTATKEVTVSVLLETGALVNGIDALGEAVLVVIDVELVLNAVVGNTVAVLCCVGAVMEEAIEVAVVVVEGTATSTVGIPPIGTISYTDKAQGPPQMKLLSPRRRV